MTEGYLPSESRKKIPGVAEDAVEQREDGDVDEEAVIHRQRVGEQDHNQDGQQDRAVTIGQLVRLVHAAWCSICAKL